MGKVAVLTENKLLAQELALVLEEAGSSAEIISVRDAKAFHKLYQESVVAAIVDSQLPNVPAAAAQDMLNSLGRRIPVVVLESRTDKSNASKTGFSMNFSDDITVLTHEDVKEIVATLDAAGVTALRGTDYWKKTLPFFNPQTAIQMLRENSGLCVLTIDASAFRDIEIEYGTDVYNRVKMVFQTLLYEMWGSPGCFRADDFLCRRSVHGNVYYVFLNRSRDAGTLPKPGVLERISDRINRKILNALWREVFMPRSERRLPNCINNIPVVSVGFASAMHNPCLNKGEVVSLVLETSMKNARVQHGRIQNLQRELMHTLIDYQELLFPNFQAVFQLGGMTRQKVEEAQKAQSIRPFESDLFGFESLIRVRTGAVERIVSEEESILDAKYLRPDVLFAIAKSTNVALELDQACLRHATQVSKKLPGKLMINILPRNLYFFDRLEGVFADREGIIFEVSESEAINNFELMMKVREILRQRRIGVAADDFGRGFAGLERVINIEPDLIKFDRSLIENIHSDPIKQAYVRGLIKAAKLLNATVLAEGVELWEEAEVLQGMGVDLVQGFLFHRPQAVETILEQIEATDSMPVRLTDVA